MQEIPQIPVPELQKFYRAKLDGNKIYFGVEEVAALQAGDVEIPHDCDLAVGAYKWSGTAFDALPPLRRKDAPSIPTTEEAFAALIKAMPNPPAECSAWLAYFETTIDGGA